MQPGLRHVPAASGDVCLQRVQHVAVLLRAGLLRTGLLPAGGLRTGVWPDLCSGLRTGLRSGVWSGVWPGGL